MAAIDEFRHHLFLRLFTSSEPALRGYVRALLPTLTDADDVMQEVAVVLWSKFAEYETDGDFRRWAFSVARFKVMAWRRDQMRDRCVLGEKITELLADDAEAGHDRLEAQRAALHLCLGRLPVGQRHLVEQAYMPGTRIDELAARAGQTAMALYKKLHRIRIALIECTRGALLKEDRG